jgi:hypothetical protein
VFIFELLFFQGLHYLSLLVNKLLYLLLQHLLVLFGTIDFLLKLELVVVCRLLLKTQFIG